jgi:hypothetical protein
MKYEEIHIDPELLNSGQKPLEVKEKPKHHRCRNCGAIYEDDFCPKCGQYGHEGRLNWKRFGLDLLGGYLTVDSGFSYTLLRLFVHPGQMIEEFIFGKRGKYSRPIQFLFTLAFIYALCFQFKYGTLNMEKIEQQQSEKIENTITKAGSEILPDELETEHKAFFDNVMSDFRKVQTSNKAFSALVMIPFATIASFWAFGKGRKKKHYTFMDILYGECYMSCQMLVISIILLPFFLPDSWAFIILTTALLLWTFKDMYDMDWWNTIWRSAATTVLTSAMMAVVALVVIFSVEGIKTLATGV